MTGTPAVLVPSPNVAADHQTVNARSLADAGAAVHLEESRLADALLETVLDLLDDEQRRTHMAAAARRMARPDAAATIARAVLEVAFECGDAELEEGSHA